MLPPLIPSTRPPMCPLYPDRKRRGKKKRRGPPVLPNSPLVYNKAACTTPVIKLAPSEEEDGKKKKKALGGVRPCYRPRSDWSRRRTRRGVPEPRSIIDVCAQLQASRHQQSVAQARLKDSWILNRRCIKIKDHSVPLTAHLHLLLHPSLHLSFLNFDTTVCPVCVCLKCAKLV